MIIFNWAWSSRSALLLVKGHRGHRYSNTGRVHRSKSLKRAFTERVPLPNYIYIPRAGRGVGRYLRASGPHGTRVSGTFLVSFGLVFKAGGIHNRICCTRPPNPISSQSWTVLVIYLSYRICCSKSRQATIASGFLSRVEGLAAFPTRALCHRPALLEDDALRLELPPLLVATAARRQRDLARGSEHPMPWRTSGAQPLL